MFNDEQIHAKWQEFKNGVRNVWGQVSDEELERTKGNLSKISSLVQSRYGETIGTVKEKLDKLLASFDNETDKHPEDIGGTSYERSPTHDRSEQNARH